MGKLWQKSQHSLDKDIEEFEVGDDYLLDMNLAKFDVWGSAAHAKMLGKIQILTSDEVNQILEGLKEILKTIEDGSFSISMSDEDVHTKVENILTEKIGDVGKKLHTARSRNDQILVDTRLYAKAEIQGMAMSLIHLCQTLLHFALEYEFVPMPGYTHMQIAMPSSVGMWTAAFIENILDELEIFYSTYDFNNMNPLGSGAGYGVSIDIDRNMTTQLLDFKRVQKNSIYCGNSRGKVEAQILSQLSGFALILNRIASDLLLFTTKEFEYFTFDKEVSTGSSIMPQKKNLDVMELVRGRTHIILGLESQLKHIIANVISGYNRDYQETKRLLMTGFSTLNQMIKVVDIVFLHLQPNTEKLREAHKPEIYATDKAYELVKQGMPFRDAYRKVGDALDKVELEDLVENIQRKKHIGATGNLQLPSLQQRLLAKKEFWQGLGIAFESAMKKLL